MGKERKINKFSNVIFRIFVVFLVLIGCDEENNVGSGSDLQIESIYLQSSQDSISDFQGTSQSLTITAICQSGDGSRIPGKIVEFSIKDHEQWMGSINPVAGDSVTNENGLMQSIYTVVLDSSGEVTLEARCEGIVGEKTITLDVTERPLRLSISANNYLFAYPDSTVQTSIIVSLKDSSFLPVPDYGVNFIIDPVTHGSLDSYSGTTDSSGRVMKVFTSIANMYGESEVLASLENGQLQTHLTIYISESSNPSVNSIELRLSHTLISGFRGEERSEQITAIARNAAGIGVQGIRIMFAIQYPASFKVTITPNGSGLTDIDGRAEATYNVVLDRDVDVVLFGRNGRIEGQNTIQIRLRDISGYITIEPGRSILVVPRGQTSQTTLTATLVDSIGLAIPGMIINFSAFPLNLGCLDIETGVTDNNGRVIRSFYTIVNQYGFCTVFAWAGDIADSTVIEIREP